MNGKGLVFAFACALALSAGLVGCASGEDNAPGEVADAFVGEWVLESIDSTEAAVDATEVQLMAEEGLVTTLVLSADGSAHMSLFGVETEGTWEAQDSDNISLLFGQDGMAASISAGKLLLVDADDEGGITAVEGTMIFNKAQADEADSASSDAA